MNLQVKICGITDEPALKAAIENGAKYVGFVFVPESRRYIAPEKARDLLSFVPSSVKTVGLFVDASDEIIEAATETAKIDMIQLHGFETPQRVAEIRSLFRLPVIKAIHIAFEKDFVFVEDYEKVSDMLLFDTKIGESPSGGTGKSFDWNLLKGKNLSLPWMLAGGINADNLANAISITGARIVDVSSGVENSKGEKDPVMIEAFLKTAAKIKMKNAAE